MNYIYKTVILPLVLFFSYFLFGCEESGTVDLLCGHGEAIELIPSYIDDNVFDRFPYSIVVKDSIVLGISSEFGEGQLQTYDICSKRQEFYLKSGRGPFESLHVNSLSLSGDTVNVSVLPDATCRYLIAEDRSENCLVPLSMEPSEGVFLNDEILSFKRNPEAVQDSFMFCSYSLLDSTRSYWGLFPDNDEIKYPEYDESKHTAYQGDLYLSPDRGKALFVYYYAIGFDILDPASQSNEHYISKTPQVTVKHVEELNANFVRGTERWQRGYAEAQVTDSCFYLLCEQNGTSYVLEYDWEAEPLRLFCFEEIIRNIFVTSSGDSLFAIVDNNGSCSLAVYDLPRCKS